MAEDPALYTRCPACQAVYEMRAATLAEAAGVVRCGNCGKTFNSLSELFDHHPDAEHAPMRGSGMPPMLEHPDMIQAELPVGHFDPPEESPEALVEDDLLSDLESREADRSGPGWLWLATSAVLACVLIVQLWMLWQTPGSPMARWLGSSAQPDIGLDPDEAIQIVSRDLHPHPSLNDAVIISTSLRNQAASAVPYPIIEVRFYDASQQVLGVRRLSPEEYLRDSEAIERGLPAGVVMPLLLEFVVGTSEPAGFQMRFY